MNSKHHQQRSEHLLHAMLAAAYCSCSTLQCLSHSTRQLTASTTSHPLGPQAIISGYIPTSRFHTQVYRGPSISVSIAQDMSLYLQAYKVSYNNKNMYCCGCTVMTEVACRCCRFCLPLSSRYKTCQFAPMSCMDGKKLQVIFVAYT